MGKPRFLYQFTILLLCAFLFSCGQAADLLYPPLEFSRIASLPGIGRSSAVAFAIGGKGYVALGRNDASTGQLNDVWEYDPATDEWAEKAFFPGVARVKACAATLGGRAYVGLGFNAESLVYNSDACLKDFWMYDPTTDSWTQLADYPSNATIACVTFTFGNSIYIGSGFNEKGFTNEFWKYSPEKNAWTRLNQFKGHGRAGAVACADNGQVFFGTGYRTLNENDWWEYFPDTDTWKELKEIPASGRVNGIGITVDKRHFVGTGRHFGGTLTTGTALSDILEYDATNNEWHKRGSIPQNGKRENAVAFTINGVGYIGLGEDSSVLSDFWSFKP